jgi:tRNA(Ile)-lysidine synthase
MTISRSMRLRSVEPALRRALKGPCKLASNTRLLVAVSGGADSTALLIGLQRVAREFTLSIRAAHLHHGLRGLDADRDLRFVRRLCAGLGVPLSWARWNTRRRMARDGASGQAGLRAVRQQFLIATARRVGATAIATGHTADDQLETLLMRLLRGAGLDGLGAMSECRGPWIKPLLSISRQDIELDLRHGGQKWREDRSNQDLRYFRSRVRHQAIPALIRALDPSAQPKSARALLAHRTFRTCQEVRDATQALEGWNRGSLSRVLSIQAEEVRVDTEQLISYPVAVQRKALRLAWKHCAGISFGLTSRHLEALEGLTRPGRGHAQAHLPRGRIAERDGRWLCLRTACESRVEAVSLMVPTQKRWTGYECKARWIGSRYALRHLCAKPPVGEFFSAEGLQGGLELRSGQADEEFVPFGRQKPVRLSKFLSGQRISAKLRSNPKVLADAGGILWVIGVRRSARAPVAASCRRVLWVRMERYD